MVTAIRFLPSMLQHMVGTAIHLAGTRPINLLMDHGLRERGKTRQVVLGFTKLGTEMGIHRAAKAVAARTHGFRKKNFPTLLTLGLCGVTQMAQTRVGFNRQLSINVKSVAVGIPIL